MNTRRSLLFFLLLATPLAGAREPEGPRKNLWIELRWVDSALSGSALAGVREGAVVVGTAGSVSPRAQQTLSTQRREENTPQVLRVMALNGYQANVQLNEQTPVQWVDYGVQIDPAATTTAAASAPTKAWAVPRQGLAEQTRGFTVTPHWPGGKQPVRVELKALDGPPPDPATAATQRAQVLSTVSIPLGEWVTVARSGTALQRPQRGVISSRDAESVTSRELQLRVDLAP